MGFSPLDGLVMSTRCGSIDPGIIIHLIQDRGMKIEDVSRLLESEAGMFGVSGETCRLLRSPGMHLHWRP